MAVYSVHMRPISEHPNPDEFVFVRDGFSLWAFLFGPFWMLRHRLWLVLLIYLAVVIALAAALHFLGASPGAKVAAGFLLCFLVGFEAATLRRFGLSRRGWNELGIVVADDLEAAERRFFDAWVKGEPRLIAPAAKDSPRARPAPAGEIIGLFPQPGGSP
jgi:hypothetical protein